METQYVTSCSIGGLHKLAYSSWGDINNPNVLICSHGLTRNRHDFDVLAEKLSVKRRVICFDLPGRGDSDWLSNKSVYDYTQYTVDALMIIARSGAERVDWLGTSMGGLLGMALASLEGSPIKKLILNDVGPLIPQAALQRIASYLGKQPQADTAEELKAYIQTIYAGLGDLTDEQWQQLFRFGHRTLENGKLTLNYDPEISQVFNNKPLEDINLWPVWASVAQPTLIIRGESSDLLLQETAEKMLLTKSNAKLISIPNTAHSPALMNGTDINLIENWLSSTE